jgi:hypothetical protein
MNDMKPDAPAQEDSRPASRPYEPPRIAWEEDWDVRANLASACAKQSGTSLDCNASPSS